MDRYAQILVELEAAKQQVKDRDALLQKCYQQRAADLKAIRRLKFAPGEYFCPKCVFRLHKRLLRARDGAVSVDNRPQYEYCPNDSTPLKRATWEQLARENEDFAKRLLSETHQLSEIESAINSTSPPNFKGAGEVVTLLEKVQWVIANYRYYAAERPIPMLLFCLQCGQQHVDAPGGIHPDNGEAWTNPPHRTHSCNFCGHRWRPSDYPTTGVIAIKTKGKDDGHPGPRFIYAINKGVNVGNQNEQHQHPEKEMVEKQ